MAGPVATELLGKSESQHPQSCNFIKVIITAVIFTRPQELKIQVTSSQAGQEW